MSKPLLDYDVLDVAVFLTEIGLPQYSQLFFEQGIDGELLVDLDDDDLVYVPVDDKDHRQYILNKVAEYNLKKPEPPMTKLECVLFKVSTWIAENAEYLPLRAAPVKSINTK